MLRRLLVCLVACCIALVVFATPAHAHAVLEESVPAANEVVTTAPEEITLTFNEPVNIKLGSFRLFDPSQAEVTTGEVVYADEEGRSIRVQSPPLGQGTHALAWHVVSSDSHRISGVLTFSVGAPSEQPPNTQALGVTEAEASKASEILQSVLRGLMFGSLLLGGGLALWLVVSQTAFGVLVPVRNIIVALLVVVAVTSALLIPVEASVVGATSLLSALDPNVISNALELRSGQSAIARIAIAALLAMLIKTKLLFIDIVQTVIPALVVILSVTVAYSGHASTGRWVTLGFVADVAHLVAAMGWLGALAVLLHVTTKKSSSISDDESQLVKLTAKAATICIALLIAAGFIQSVRQVGALNQFIDSRYGQLVIAKVLLVSIIVVIGAMMRKRLADFPPGAVKQWARSVRKSVLVELLLIAIVIGVTTHLVTAVPSTVLAKELGTSSPVENYSAQKSQGEVTFTLFVDGARKGNSELRLKTQTLSGLSENLIGNPRATLTAPRGSSAPREVALNGAGVGEFNGTAEFDQPGLWTMKLSYIDPTGNPAEIEFEIPVG